LTSNIVPHDINFGRALYGIHAVWAMALDYWQRTNQDYADWDDIEFDKLAHCIHLIWNKLHETKEVTFRSAYQSAPGIHGPGPALFKKGSFNNPLHATKVINHIQTSFRLNPDINLFSLQAKRSEKYKVGPGRKGIFLPVYLSSSYPRTFREEDMNCADLLSTLLSKLSRNEIRALGTHQSKNGTLESIEYNTFIHLFRKIMLEFRTLEDPRTVTLQQAGDGKWTSELPSTLYILNEIEKKSLRNRGDYASGRDKILKESRQNKTAAIAAKTFDAPEDIWDSEEVKKWYIRCEMLGFVLAYTAGLKALRDSLVPPEDHGEWPGFKEKTEKQADVGNKARIPIATFFGIDLPLIPSSVESVDWKRIKNGIVQIFDQFPHITGCYKVDYDRIKWKYQ
jgi:hypothetical protein